MTSTRRPVQKSVIEHRHYGVGGSWAVRVGLTLEQLWHRVPGGVATYVAELGRALAERDDVTVTGWSAAHRRDPDRPEHQPPVPVHRLALPRPLLYASWHRLRRPRLGGVDVVHATTAITPPTAKVPLVVTVHDLAFLHDPSHFAARGVRVMRRGFDLLRAEAALILCVSADTAADCEAHGIERGRLRVVLNGVRSNRAEPDDVARVTDRYGLDTPYLVFAGTLEPRKNLPRLVEAVRRLGPSNRLVVVGPQGWGEGQSSLGAGVDVRFTGFVPAADLAALYAGAEVACYPSLREGFGLPVLEAMAQGTPVVTSRGTATEEVAAGAAVLVDPLDVDAIAAGIDEARRRAATLGPAGQARAAELTWRRTADETVRVYREVVDGHR